MKKQMEINIATLLKGCPKGTKLYSPICGECELFNVTTNTDERIYVMCHGRALVFNKYGCADFKDGECLLFPSNEIRDWNLFQVQYVKMTGETETDDKLKKLLDIDHPVLNRKEYLPDAILYRGRLDNEVYTNRANDDEYNFILATGKELKLEEESN